MLLFHEVQCLPEHHTARKEMTATEYLCKYTTKVYPEDDARSIRATLETDPPPNNQSFGRGCE